MGQSNVKDHIASNVSNVSNVMKNCGFITDSKFDTQYKAITHEEIVNIIDKYGICYVPDVLNNEERLNMISGTWDFFEHITGRDMQPIMRSDPATWSSFDSLDTTLGMIYHYWNVGHAQHLWDIRQNTNIIKIFTNLLHTNPNNLLVSFDGLGFLLPPEYTNINWHKEKDCNLHLDQRLSYTEQKGFQSFVTAYDIEEGDASIRFLEGSHKHVRQFVNKFGEFCTDDLIVFKDEHIEYYKEHCEEKFLKCPAKSLVLWDSRLVHCVANPRRNRKNENMSCIAYLSYAEKDEITNEDLELKKLALQEKYTSNHYANHATYFPTYPTNYNKQHYDSIKSPHLTPMGYSLVGYNDNEINSIFTNDDDF